MVDHYTVIIQLVAILSALSSIITILTTLIFEEMRQKLFMRLVCYISISDFMANIFYGIYYRPENDTPFCSFQGFINIYFYPVSWMWTTVMVYFLYSLAMKGKLPLSMGILHGICWGIPLIFALLGLYFSPNGRADGTEHFEVCTIKRGFVSYLYHVITYYGLWFTTVSTMVYMYYKVKVMDINEIILIFPTFNLAKKALEWYPLVMIICWIPHIISVLLYTLGYDVLIFYFLGVSVKVSHGFLTSCVFFYKSREARLNWYYLFSSIFCCYKEDALLNEENNKSRTTSNDSTRVRDFSIEYPQGYDDESINSNSKKTGRKTESMIQVFTDNLRFSFDTGRNSNKNFLSDQFSFSSRASFEMASNSTSISQALINEQVKNKENNTV